MKTVNEYAVELVVEGAEHVAEDDLNENGDIDDASHKEACDLAIEIAHAIRGNPQAVLALVGRCVNRPQSTPAQATVAARRCRVVGWSLAAVAVAVLLLVDGFGDVLAAVPGAGALAFLREYAVLRAWADGFDAGQARRAVPAEDGRRP